LTSKLYSEWLDKYREAQQIRDKPRRERKMFKLVEWLENDYKLLGSTAVEDNLQTDVPETIKDLNKANIKVWMLTGDKEETAVNIGYSAGLLSNHVEKLFISGSRKAEVFQQLNDCKTRQVQLKANREKFSLVVSGDALDHIAHHYGEAFINLAKECVSLVCARMSPKQKTVLVQLVQKYDSEKVVLTVGDGANDMGMLNTANVGVAICGVEGRQAVSASDYAIGQFKFLKPLILWHGRENYRRNSYLVNYTLYKNFVFVLPLLIYGIWNRFSSQAYYEIYLLEVFNLIFTAAPIVFYAVLDQEHSKQDLLNYPCLYAPG